MKTQTNYINIVLNGKNLDSAREFSNMSYAKASILLMELEKIKLELIEYAEALPRVYDIRDNGDDE